MNLNNSATRAILIRHGRSTFNQQQRYQGSSDCSGLTEEGCKTARQVGEWLQNLPIDAIYVSPLRRAQQTLHEIQTYVDRRIPVYVHSCLREIELPAWEGLPYQQVKTEFTDAYYTWKQQPHKFKMASVNKSGYASSHAFSNISSNSAVVASSMKRDCFPVLDLYLRAEQFWQDVLPHRRGQTIVSISHGGTNHALISTALGLSPAHHHGLQQSNCGISILDFAAHSRDAQLAALNLTTHLGETLPKLKEGKQGLRLLLVPSAVDSTHTTDLAEFLKPISIDFSLTNDPNHQTVERLLTHHPSTVKLQVCREQFLQDWLQTLRWKQISVSNLTTGLVVASPSSLQMLLAEATGLSSDQCWRFQLQPGSLSVLYYPNSDHRPILQAMNLQVMNVQAMLAATQTSFTLGGTVNG
jgi:phosphoserine phosphatase